jgi:predicted HicB family RNase H-like nuclease
MATEARIRANAKYEKKAYQNIRVRIRQDDPEISLESLQSAADAAGQSVNAYVIQAIKDRMNKK